MRAHPILQSLLILAVAASCNADSVVGPRDFRRLLRAQAIWNARSFADYRYEIRISCFCPPEMNQWTRVSVQGGAVVAAEAVEPDPLFPIGDIRFWVPIDVLFENLYESMTQPASRSYLDEIVVDYDSELGYPTSIEYRARSNVSDGGAVYSLRNVTPLE